MDERTLDVVAREDEVFPEGGTPAAHSVGRGFGAMVRWRTPRPPGTQPDPGPRTTCEVSGKHAVRFHLPSQAVRRQPGGSS